MANRFWVGGAAAWDGTASTKWALTSGGAGGQAVPTPSDDVVFDSASGAVTCTISGSRTCKSLTCTGFTGTLTGTSSPVLSIAGTLHLGVNMTVGTLNVVTSGSPIISNTKTITSLVVNNLSFCLLFDNLTVSGSITVSGGELDGNTENVTAASLSVAAGASLDLDTGTWTINGTGTVWDMSSSATVIPGSSTIKINDASASSKTFDGGSRAYNNIWFSGAGTGAFIIKGSNTFADFKVDTPPHTVQFEGGSTQTVTSFTVSGSSGAALNTLEPDTSSAWNVTCVAGASISFVSLRGSHAHGAAFVAANSFDAGDNQNWDFVRQLSDVIYFDSAYQYSGAAIGTVESLNWLIGETLGIVADGVDIGDAAVDAHGRLVLPNSVTASAITVGKRYLSRGVTLRAPQSGNQDGSALGRKMAIVEVFADMLDSAGLYVGTLQGTRPIPPAWKQTNDGDLYTGIFPVPINDKHDNGGVIVFETDRGYPCTLRALQMGVEGEP